MTPELGFAQRIHEWDFALRDPLTALYRALRAAGEARGEACEAVLRGEGPQPRSAALAGRLVRVLAELELVGLDREGPALEVAETPGSAPRSSARRPSGPTSDGSRTDWRYLTSSNTSASSGLTPRADGARRAGGTPTATGRVAVAAHRPVDRRRARADDGASRSRPT